MAAIVDKEKCEGCGDCVPVCPVEAIAVQDEKANVDQNTCIDCGACVDACLPKAIEIK